MAACAHLYVLRAALEDRATVRSKEHRRRLLASILREQTHAPEDYDSVAVEESSVAAMWDSEDEKETHEEAHRVQASRCLRRSSFGRGSTPHASGPPSAELELWRCKEQLVAATQYIEELESEIAWTNANASTLSAAETPPHSHTKRGGDRASEKRGAREMGGGEDEMNVDQPHLSLSPSPQKAPAMTTDPVPHHDGGGGWPRTTPRALEALATGPWHVCGAVDKVEDKMARQARMAAAEEEAEEAAGAVVAEERQEPLSYAEQQRVQRLRAAHAALHEANRTILFCTTSTLHCLRRIHHVCVCVCVCVYVFVSWRGCG